MQTIPHHILKQKHFNSTTLWSGSFDSDKGLLCDQQYVHNRFLHHNFVTYNWSLSSVCWSFPSVAMTTSHIGELTCNMDNTKIIQSAKCDFPSTADKNNKIMH